MDKVDELFEHVDHFVVDKKDWGAADLKRVADTLYGALNEIRQHPEKIFDEKFMLGIFDEYRLELPTTFGAST